MLIVTALGGNALLRRGEPMTAENQRRNVRIACEVARRPYALQAAPRWMLRLLGIVMPVVRESIEMLYQFEYYYRFDSSKVERVFGFTATTYREGLAATLAA